MRVKGRDQADWGFRVATPGWHTVSFQEGIDIFTNATSGKQSVTIPMTIDEGGSDDGIKLTVFCPYKDDNGDYSQFGEQKVADCLSAAGLYEKFEERFPGDISLFESQVLEAIKVKLPGCFAKVKLELDKAGKYTNIIQIANLKADTGAASNPSTDGAKTAGASKNVNW